METDWNKSLVDAAFFGDLKAVHRAVKNGANIHYNDEAALLAAVDCGCLKTVQYLVNKGADITVQNNKALELTKKHNKPDVFRFLVKRINK
jgi:hypothetical protein